RYFPKRSPSGPISSCVDPWAITYPVTTTEATPTEVPKSLAICGRSESVTRTCAWLANPAIARSTIERVGVGCAAVMIGADNGMAVRAAVDRKKRSGFLAQLARRTQSHDRQDLQLFRDRTAHLCGLGSRRRVPCRPARAAGGGAVLYRHSSAQCDRLP